MARPLSAGAPQASHPGAYKAVMAHHPGPLIGPWQDEDAMPWIMALLVSGCESQPVTTGGCLDGSRFSEARGAPRPPSAGLSQRFSQRISPGCPPHHLPRSPPGHLMMALKRHARPQLRPTGPSLFLSSIWDELNDLTDLTDLNEPNQPETRPQTNGEPRRPTARTGEPIIEPRRRPPLPMPT
ncbi:hypothetical protein G7Z17_g8315 [Cylindrodendrum hubeiense]|uniref:Uncharacterized protein n=1 Tax=Cylindrodendrum hubeiense TaxID=595255 RepID=A0A9P5H799_9HYPO|nr:hypothetical protein G7Z17_g8315 [Cylindrodendrum hubeiense]